MSPSELKDCELLYNVACRAVNKDIKDWIVVRLMYEAMLSYQASLMQSEYDLDIAHTRIALLAQDTVKAMGILSNYVKKEGAE